MSSMHAAMRVLALTEPWAFALFHLGMDVVNMPRPTEHRGTVLVCTSFHIEVGWSQKVMDLWRSELPWQAAALLPRRWDHLRACLRPGMALGTVELVGCQREHPSRWAVPEMTNWVVRDPRPFQRPFRVRGVIPAEIDDRLVQEALPSITMGVQL